MILLVALLIPSALIYHRLRTEQEEHVIVQIEGGELSDEPKDLHETEDDLLLTEQDALNLASEQVDINQYNLAIHEGIAEIEGRRYYLVDFVDKSGPSFAMQMAIDIRSGTLFAYDPAKERLLPMTEFPLETPITQEQDWNGVFTREAREGAAFAVELLQGDPTSFEFHIVKEGDMGVFRGVAQISAGTALYEDESGFTFIFTKNAQELRIKVLGLSPLEQDDILLEGLYRAE